MYKKRHVWVDMRVRPMTITREVLQQQGRPPGLIMPLLHTLCSSSIWSRCLLVLVLDLRLKFRP